MLVLMLVCRMRIRTVAVLVQWPKKMFSGPGLSSSWREFRCKFRVTSAFSLNFAREGSEPPNYRALPYHIPHPFATHIRPYALYLNEPRTHQSSASSLLPPPLFDTPLLRVLNLPPSPSHFLHYLPFLHSTVACPQYPSPCPFIHRLPSLASPGVCVCVCVCMKFCRFTFLPLCIVLSLSYLFLVSFQTTSLSSKNQQYTPRKPLFELGLSADATTVAAVATANAMG